MKTKSYICHLAPRFLRRRPAVAATAGGGDSDTGRGGNGRGGGDAGFSLLELVVAAGLLFVVMTVAFALLAGGLNLKAGEARRETASLRLARSVETVRLIIEQSGYGMTSNGLVGGDCTSGQIRVRRDLNHYTGGGGATNDYGEDTLLYLAAAADGAGRERKYLLAFDAATHGIEIIGEDIDAVNIKYFPAPVEFHSDACEILSPAAETAPAAAGFVVVLVCARVPAFGTPGASGYQPPVVVSSSAGINLNRTHAAAF